MSLRASLGVTICRILTRAAIAGKFSAMMRHLDLGPVEDFFRALPLIDSFLYGRRVSQRGWPELDICEVDELMAPRPRTHAAIHQSPAASHCEREKNRVSESDRGQADHAGPINGLCSGIKSFICRWISQILYGPGPIWTILQVG